MNPRALLIAGVVVSGVLLLGCNRDEPVRFYRAPKEQPTTSMAGPAANATSPEAAAGGEIQWTVPGTWKPLPAGQMTYAAFAVSDEQPPLTLTITSLASGLDVPSNVNRWETQIGLQPTPGADLAKIVKHSEAAGSPVDSVDLLGVANAGKQERIMAAMITRPDHTWFIKLRGPAEKVEAKKAEFDAFVASIHFGAATSGPAAVTPPANHFGGGEGIVYQIPAGWTKEEEKPMRQASFLIGAGEQQVEVIVSLQPTTSFQNVLANVNRWRGQVGLGDLKDAEEAKKGIAAIAIGTGQGDLFDFVGPAGAGQRRMLVALGVQGDELWFFKIAGAAAAVQQNRATFEQFLKSVRFQ